ncbi:hypothetical protein OROMI_021103 [Orobanche minor]
MEFWGARVERGQSFDVKLGGDRCLHLRLASLGPVGENEKPEEYIFLEFTVDGEKYVSGVLSLNMLTQIDFDLVFDDDFQITHTSNNTCVCFFGYTTKKLQTKKKRQGEGAKAEKASSATEEIDTHGRR